MDVFWAKGYEGAQLTDLTAAMGINPPSFYAAFGCKEAIFREAVDHYEATVGFRTVRALQKTGTAREVMVAMLTESVDTALAAPGHGGCLFIVGIVSCAKENEPLRRHLEGFRRTTVARIRRRLDRAVSEGDLSADADTRGLAIFFGTMIQGLSLQARDGASRKDLLRVVAAAASVLPGG